MSAMSSQESILRDIAGRIPGVPEPRKRALFIALMVVGLATFATMLATNPLRAWGSWAINTLYFLGIAEAGVVLAAAIRLSNGRWGGPIMRIGESLSSYLPFGIGTMLVLLLAGIWTYLPWTKHVEPRIAPYVRASGRSDATVSSVWWIRITSTERR